MITTSEIKISVLVNNNVAEATMNEIHKLYAHQMLEL